MQEVCDRSRDLQDQPDVDQSLINNMTVQQIPLSWMQGKSTLDLQEAQLLDPDISPVLKWKEEGNKGPSCKEISSLNQNIKTYVGSW